MNIVLLGAPGSGKGTIAKILQNNNNMEHVSTGDLLREAVSKGTVLGKKADKFMKKGELVPEELVIDLMKEKVSGKKSVVLDGFPRTIVQAEALKIFCNIDKVLNFIIQDKVIVKRLISRRTCKKCGAIFNIESLPPKVANECDTCGGRLFHREDDKEGTIRERFNQYRQKTEPLIEYYKKQGILVNIDAGNTPEETYSKVLIEVQDESNMEG